MIEHKKYEKIENKLQNHFQKNLLNKYAQKEESKKDKKVKKVKPLKLRKTIKTKN